MEHQIKRYNDSGIIENVKVELLEGAIIRYEKEHYGSVQKHDNGLAIFWDDNMFTTELDNSEETTNILKQCTLIMNGQYRQANKLEFFDITLHFTIKTQTVEQVKEKFEKWLEKTSLISPNIADNKSVVLHHCFLTREIVEQKGFAPDVLDFIESIADYEVSWFKSMETITSQRNRMLENLRRLDGLAIFIGDVVEGVAEEYNIVSKLGIANIHIE